MVPGGPSDVLVSLEAGQYVLLCFVTSADGVPHLAKGMMRPLTRRGDRHSIKRCRLPTCGWSFAITGSSCHRP